MKLTATLVSRDGRRWEFEVASGTGDQFIHRTRYGNVYAILPGLHAGKPFWVGREFFQGWATWEGKLGARCIEFDGGGKYFFPGWGETRVGA